MDGRDIPGHYYDVELKKYFRIIPNHLAPPGSKYSQAAVNKEKEEKELRQAEALHQAKLKEQRVQRSAMLSSALGGGIAATRETAANNSTRHIQESTVRIYAGGLEEAWRSKMKHSARAFAYDEATTSLLVGSSAPSLKGFVCAVGPVRDSGMDRRHGDPADMLPMPNPITSVSVSPSRHMMFTTLGGERPAGIAIATLSDPAQSTLPNWSTVIKYDQIDNVDCWTCAANPFLHNQATFAAGASAKTVLYDAVQGDWDTSQKLHVDSDVLALEWLTPTVVSIGMRNGDIQLWDLRSGGNVQRLTVPGRVTGIRRLTPQALVVCAIPDVLAMYDLRMPTFGENVAKYTNKRKRRGPTTILASLPAVRYPYRCKLTQPGFDVDPSTGTVAAIDNYGFVQIYALHSGKKLRSLPIFKQNNTGTGLGDVSVLKFCHAKESGVNEQHSRREARGTGWDQLIAASEQELVGIRWCEKEEA